MTSNLDQYQNKAKQILSKLDDTIERIKVIEKSSDVNKLNELVKILTDIEEDGKSLEKIIEPINKEIEKLAQEESELYRQIKTKHSNLSEEQIIESVKERLIKENL